MAQRERRINGVRLYSDILDEGDINSKSKTVQTYKKVQSTTKTVTKVGSNPSQTTITKKATISKNYGVPRNSVGSIQPQIKETVAKEKYTYSGKLKEKENYLYYVSGIGYVNKDGVPTKPDNKPKEIKVLSNKPKPTRKVGERVTITLYNTRPERKGGKLIENFEYHETKDLGEHNKESLVVHRRLGDPFYQNIKGGRSSSYTQVQRSKNILDGKDTSIQTKTIQTTTIQRKQYENNTNNRASNAQQNSKYNRPGNQSSYQRTINIEERKRTVVSNPRIEKNFAESNKRRATSQETKKYEPKKYEPKKYIPTQKKYQEKTDDIYKRNTQNQIQPKIQPKVQPKPVENKRVFDTNKYNTNKNNMGNNMNNNADNNNMNNNARNNVPNANAYQSKYQQKTEETQKTEFSQENNNLLNDPNYCPIHGYHGQGNQSNINAINAVNASNAGMNSNINANYGSEEIDNYRFYESKNVTRKVQNVNTNINTNMNINSNINTQNIVNTEENVNVNAAYMNAMNQEQMAQAQGEEGYDMSKLYIATNVVPVYSEMLDQQYQNCTHVCNVCGNPFDENQIDMMQQNQMSSMQEVEYDINCPIHGQQRPQ